MPDGPPQTPQSPIVGRPPFTTPNRGENDIGHSTPVTRTPPSTCGGRYFLTAGAALSLIGAAPARRTFLSNLPTEVLGTSSMNRTSSGSHHLATLSRRKSMISSCVTLPLNSGLATA